MTSDRPESIYEDAPEVSERCMERASRFLSYKPRIRHELIKHLTERGFGTEEASLCADRMEEYRLIDDLEYSRMYFEAMFERGKGLDRIRRELAEKGVDRNTIEDSLLLIEEVPDAYEAALEQAQMALAAEDVRDLTYEEREKIKGRIARRLARKGYPADAIYRAVREALEIRLSQEEE